MKTSKITAIVVEDENKIREGFINIIDWKSYGVEIIGSARNGQEGLHLIERLNPDLAFIDLNMPVMSGLEMLKEIREDQHVTSIIISGYSEFSYAQEALRHNVFDYLLKPVDTEELVDVLERYIESHLLNQRIKDTEILLDEFLQIPFDTNNPSIYKMLQYIEKNISSNITSQVMADFLGISVSKLNYMCKEEVGESFHKYLSKYRIRTAMGILILTDDMVYEVGIKVGFPDYKYFSDVFRKTVGLTISEFRNQNI